MQGDCVTYAHVKQRLLRAVAAANESHGAENQVPSFVAAIESFPQRSEDVEAYRTSLTRLAPEIRRVLEDALLLVPA